MAFRAVFSRDPGFAYTSIRKNPAKTDKKSTVSLQIGTPDLFTSSKKMVQYVSYDLVTNIPSDLFCSPGVY